MTGINQTGTQMQDFLIGNTELIIIIFPSVLFGSFSIRIVV